MLRPICFPVVAMSLVFLECPDDDVTAALYNVSEIKVLHHLCHSPGDPSLHVPGGFCHRQVNTQGEIQIETSSKMYTPFLIGLN